MSNERLDQKERPLQEWLPVVALKFLVFLAFAFVLYKAAMGLGEQELTSGRVWIIVAGMVGLLLLLVVDRLIRLKVSPAGMEATLDQIKARALGEMNEIEDRDAAEAARAQILQAENPDQVQAAVVIAVELNANRVIERVKSAVRSKHKVYVRYQSDPAGPVDTYLVAPLDVKPGKTPATKANDYVWAYSYEHESAVSLRLGRVMGVELSEETFDPAELMADWKNKEPEWNVAREW